MFTVIFLDATPPLRSPFLSFLTRSAHFSDLGVLFSEKMGLVPYPFAVPDFVVLLLPSPTSFYRRRGYVDPTSSRSSSDRSKSFPPSLFLFFPLAFSFGSRSLAFP